MQNIYETKPQPQEIVLAHLPKRTQKRHSSLYPTKPYYPINEDEYKYRSVVEFRKLYAKYRGYDL